MAKIPFEFRTNEFKDNLLINSFSQFDGVVVPNLSSVKFGTIYIVDIDEENFICTNKAVLSFYDLDLFLNSCILYKNELKDSLTAVYFSYQDDDKTDLHVVFYVK